MNESELRKLLGEILADIAPEADLGNVAADEDLREALDLDSMDFLNVLIGVHERTGIDIPEADYPQLFTLKTMAGYLAARQ